MGKSIGIDFGTTNNSFYLNTSLVNENADKTMAKTESEMKSSIISNLGEMFVADNDNKNNGYPVLKW